MALVNPLLITNLLCIFTYLLKSGLTVGICDISTFSMVLWLFVLHLMGIFLMTYSFWERNIVYQCLTVAK